MRKVRKKRHEHSRQCITSAWHECPGLNYLEWVRLAAEGDISGIWRHHELTARHHRRTDDPLYVDLGGEG